MGDTFSASTPSVTKVANERHESLIVHVVNTHLSFLLIEIVNDDTNEEIEGEERAKNDEDDKVQVHVEVNLSDGLFLHLKKKNCFMSSLETVSSHFQKSRCH